MSATRQGGRRLSPSEQYPTPAWCVDLLLDELTIPARAIFLEPCRGVERAIYDRVPAERKLWAEIAEGVDYLSTNYKADLIITNPPFSLASEFLAKSLQEADTVAYLLRLGFLGSKKRREFWRANPPTHLFALSRRPSFVGKGTDSADYGWFVWDRSGLCTSCTGIHVL